MRLDKFLKVSRIIKRRSVAKDISDQGRILINGKKAKSSTNLNINDELEIHFGNKTLVVQVLALLETTKKEDADKLYEVIREDYAQDFSAEV